MMDLELLKIGLMGMECSCVFACLFDKLETVDKAVEIVRGLMVKEGEFASVDNVLVLLEQKLLKFRSGMLYGEECVFEALGNDDKETLLTNPRTIEIFLVPWVC